VFKIQAFADLNFSTNNTNLLKVSISELLVRNLNMKIRLSRTPTTA